MSFKRNNVGIGQTVPEGVTQSDTQGDTQSDTQESGLDMWIEEQIRKNSTITTKEMAKLRGIAPITIKRHIAKLSHIKYVGSGYSGHWEIVEIKKVES